MCTSNEHQHRNKYQHGRRYMYIVLVSMNTQLAPHKSNKYKPVFESNIEIKMLADQKGMKCHLLS